MFRPASTKPGRRARLESEGDNLYDHQLIRRPRAARPLLHPGRPIRLRRRGDRRSLAAPPGAGRAGQAGRPPPRDRHRHRAGRPRRTGPLRSPGYPGTHPLPPGPGREAILMADVRRSPQAETDLEEILEDLQRKNPAVAERYATAFYDKGRALARF